MLHTICIVAQVQQGYAQTEYIVAIALTIAMVALGLAAVCVPRKRKKHYVEPEEADARRGGKKKR